MDHHADPVDALQILRVVGFGGRQLFGDRGRATTLHYRRTWRGVSDVVLVYAADDAEAYRADDALPADSDPFDVATRTDLLQEVVGTVVEVVRAVLAWPVPESWTSHFPPASAPGSASPPCESGAH